MKKSFLWSDHGATLVCPHLRLRRQIRVALLFLCHRVTATTILSNQRRKMLKRGLHLFNHIQKRIKKCNVRAEVVMATALTQVRNIWLIAKAFAGLVCAVVCLLCFESLTTIYPRRFQPLLRSIAIKSAGSASISISKVPCLHSVVLVALTACAHDSIAQVLMSCQIIVIVWKEILYIAMS